MTDIPLRIEFTPRAQRSTCARFISSADPAQWLKELAAWKIPLDGLKLYPIPRSLSDNTCAGVLVSLGQSGEILSARDDSSSARSVPYGRVAGRLFLPVEAELSIALGDSDWKRVLGTGLTEFVWHPHTGLVAFEPDEVLTVVDLLSPAVPGGVAVEPVVDWGMAEPGVAFSSRIGSIRAELPESAAEMLDDGRDGIGTRSQNILSRPAPVSHQLKWWGQTIVGYAMLPVAMLANVLAKMLSPKPSATTASGSPLTEGLSLAVFFACAAVLFLGIWSAISGGNLSPDWAAVAKFLIMLCGFLLATLLFLPPLQSIANSPAQSGNRHVSPARNTGAGVSWNLQQQMNGLLKWTVSLLNSRLREIERLKRLLDEDPDEGLKYALPVGGEGTRGGAPASSSLMARTVDFQLQGMSFGGIGDVWELPVETHIELITRYRALAAREVQLGRYRRAAYIYAQLLGDLNLAAATLVNGRFYREAAVLYRDKLHMPLEAARCLEEGGLLAESILIYRQQGQHEKVGDLSRKLGDEEHAVAAYEDAVQGALQKTDYLDAARLCDQKLQSPDRAMESLDFGWPDSPQAKICLNETFSLLARQGQHDEAVQRIESLVQASLPTPRVTDAVGVLAKLATGSPHAQTRLTAADSVRLIASRELLLGASNRHQLTAAVSQLAPEDRLLLRDCQRANDMRAPKVPEKTSSSVRRPVKEMRLIRTFDLPKDITWTSATGTDRNFYVVGRSMAGIVVVARGAWNDPSARIDTVGWRPELTPAVPLICHAMNDRKLFIGPVNDAHLPVRRFMQSDANPDEEEIVTPAWMPKSIAALASSPNGMIYTYQPDQLLLSGVTSQGQPTIAETLLIPTERLAFGSHMTFPMVALNDAVYLGIGRYLIEAESRQRSAVREMPEPIAALAASHPNVGRRVAFIGENVGEFFWSSMSSGRSKRFDVTLENPYAAILRSRDLVIHGTGRWKVFVTTDDQIHCLHDIPCDPQLEPCGLLRADLPRRFGLCTTDGQVHLYELPS